jgi:hypothetical protein
MDFFLLSLITYLCKKNMYTFLAKLNKLLLPSYSKKGLDLTKASKLQMAIIGWRYFVTTKSLESNKK